MKKSGPFVISLLGMAVSAALLIVRIPPFFRSGEQDSAWVIAVLGCLTVAFAVPMLRWRPSASVSRGR